MAIGADQTIQHVSLDDETRKLAAEALRKQKEGKTPSVREEAALRKVRASQENAVFERLVREVPKETYKRWTGRQSKVLLEQADRYGLPLGEKKINVPELCRAIHDFLAKNKFRFVDDDPLMAGAQSPALEEYRRVKTKQEELKLAQMRADLVDRHVVRDCLGHLANQLRVAGDRAEQLFGPNGRDLLTQVLDGVEQEIAKLEPEDVDDPRSSERAE